MGMLGEFKAFAMKGNVMDMAVGIIIGIAFGKIISSLVADIIMPPIGVLLGGVDFKNLMIVMKPATDTAVAVSINYGVFINTLIDFVIIAFVIFMIVKGMNSMKKKEEAKPAAPAEPNKQEVLLAEIRDLLKK
ncbi:MAG: large-conductance mechanosensitive channel protein MscL [Candidatus Woesearchaeota archaeon]